MIAEAAAETTPHSRLAEWLRFDPSQIPAVEEAYTTFLDRTKYGWWLLGAIVASFVVAVVFAFAHVGEPAARTTAAMLPAIMATFYGVQLLPLLLVPLPTFATMLRGCVDVRRAVLLGVVLGVLAVLVELASYLVLSKTSLKRPVSVDPLSYGLFFGVTVMLVAAPFVEEFQMQAWLQSRLRPAGGFWAGLLTTVVFVAMHVPKTVFEVIRVATLGFAAILRGTTRSLAASIAVHFTNNLILTAMLLASRTLPHADHLSHGAHP